MKRYLVLALTFWFGVSTANSAPRIAVLDFELNDITSLPNTPAEVHRTASIAPLLGQALNQSGNIQLIAIPKEAQLAANAGFGYLFRFHDLAAKLGQKYGTDWIVVSQHSKPSFLYSYLRTYLVNVKTGTAVARYDIEMKGNHESVTRHAVKALAHKIHNTLINSTQ